MTEYLEPTAFGEAEFTEKRSTFIGHVWPVSTEEEARARIEEMKKKYYDARHNCWCYILHDGPVRYSDDGEPQGTAGQPMLNVFQREGVENMVCVVTRYFGGVLLGAGGLVRAYTQGAKNALDAAGVSIRRIWDQVEIACSYAFFERVKLLITACEGLIADTEYGADILLHAMFPQAQTAIFQAQLTELSNGQLIANVGDPIYRAFPVQPH